MTKTSVVARLILHTHHHVSGPRGSAGYRNGKWDDGIVTHSHVGGEIPHTHEHTGPASYGYRNHRKFTKRPNGEQLGPVIPRTEEENTFELVVTDTAQIGVEDGFIPIGNTPLEAMGFPAADRMIETFGMKCIIRDERTPGYVPSPTDISGQPWSKKKLPGSAA